MPFGAGLQVFRVMSAAQPLRMPSRPLVIAISGRASAVEAFELAKAGVHAFLPKPFSKAELAHCVRRALDQRR